MLKLKIFDSEWKIYLFSEEKYVTEWSDADAAHTIPSTHEIYFNEEELDRETVIHELTHAFYAELCTSSASLTGDQVEEVMCDLVGKHGDKILRLGRKLFKELKTYEEAEE